MTFWYSKSRTKCYKNFKIGGNILHYVYNWLAISVRKTRVKITWADEIFNLFWFCKHVENRFKYFDCTTKLLDGFSTVWIGTWLFLDSALNNMLRHIAHLQGGAVFWHRSLCLYLFICFYMFRLIHRFIYFFFFKADVYIRFTWWRWISGWFWEKSIFFWQDYVISCCSVNVHS